MVRGGVAFADEAEPRDGEGPGEAGDGGEDVAELGVGCRGGDGAGAGEEEHGPEGDGGDDNEIHRADAFFQDEGAEEEHVDGAGGLEEDGVGGGGEFVGGDEEDEGGGVGGGEGEGTEIEGPVFAGGGGHGEHG